MVDKMEGLLVQSVIDAVSVKSSDIALERMTNIAMRDNLHAQTSLARFNEGRVKELKSELQNIREDLQSKNTEKKELQQKLKTAMGMYEEANSNTKAWIDLLNKPFHEIASSHPGFNKNYDIHLKKFADLVLDGLSSQGVLEDLAEKHDYSELDIFSMKNKEALKILNNTNSNDSRKAANIPIIQKFKKELVAEYSDEAIELAKEIQEIKQSGKTFK